MAEARPGNSRPFATVSDHCYATAPLERPASRLQQVAAFKSSVRLEFAAAHLLLLASRPAGRRAGSETMLRLEPVNVGLLGWPAAG